MPTLKQYWESAQLAQAAYVELPFLTDQSVVDRLRSDVAPSEYRFSDTQARRLIGPSGFSIADNRANANDAVGFSATLFRDNRPGGRYVLALRGTEPLTPADQIYSIGQISSWGLAAHQIASAYNYFQRLITRAGEAVPQIDVEFTLFQPADGRPNVRVSGLLEGTSGYLALTRYTANNAIGTLAELPAGTRIDVTGHSLGGHLGQALSRLFPTWIENAYAHNTAGFYPLNADPFFRLIDPGVGGFDAAKIKNVFSYNGGEYITNTLLHTPGGHPNSPTRGHPKFPHPEHLERRLNRGA
jgi:hypothetical protein